MSSVASAARSLLAQRSAFAVPELVADPLEGTLYQARVPERFASNVWLKKLTFPKEVVHPRTQAKHLVDVVVLKRQTDGQACA